MKKSIFKGNSFKIVFIALLILVVTVFHYRTDHLLISVHVLFRELYFLPIVLSGFWYGVRGGLTVSLAITVLYFPYILSLPEGITGHNLGNFLQIVIFNMFAIIIGLLRDREKKQQQKRVEAEGLAAMGRAVSCIAHDMKTPLIAIGGFSQQVRRKIKEDILVRKMDLIIAQVRRLELLVGDMLAFARPLQLRCVSGAVTDLIDEIVAIAQEKATVKEVQIRTEFQQGIPLCDFDAQRLQQAILNLINNAIEASPPGGEVLIRCNCQARNIVIEVIDQGGGILKEHRENIFTPFMTTKKEGTGLGLPIVKKVVEAHAGSVGVDIIPGGGTNVYIRLPSLAKSQTGPSELGC